MASTPPHHASILELLRPQSEGLGPQQLRQLLNNGAPEPISERTLLRRLRELEAAGQVRAQGLSRARRYFAVTTVRPDDKSAPDTNTELPLSPEGAQIRDRLLLPSAQRAPAGYQRSFLQSYQPGNTWYLTEAMRVRLHELGRVPGPDQPAGTFARGIAERLLIDLSWASSKMEGNTYSLLDTQNLLENGIRAEGKDAAEAQMILNHKKGIELLVDQAGEIAFNRYTLLNLHAALSENLLDDPNAEGRLRTRAVSIYGSPYVPLAIPQQIEEYFDLILQKATAIPDAFEQSFFMMVHLPNLQPFIDVNKRTSRLAANISLIKSNLCPLSFIGVPEAAYVHGTLAVYEFNDTSLLRDAFMWTYERSCLRYQVVRESLGQPDPTRLRYRELLSQLVSHTVRLNITPRTAHLMQWAVERSIPEIDREAFVRSAMEMLLSLHEGAISRYGIRPSEFRAWKTHIAVATTSPTP